MARFYGWTDDEIDRLPFSRFVLYLKAIDNLSAIEDLRACSVASFGNSNLRKDSRQKTLAQLKKQSSDSIELQNTSFADVAKALAKGIKNNG